MNQQRSARIAALIIGLHGAIELLGPVLLLVGGESAEIPFAEYQQAPQFFTISIGLIYGLLRLVSLRPIWQGKRWGLYLGASLSLVSMILGYTIIPAGIMDTLLGGLAMMFLLRAIFGEQRLFMTGS